MNDEMTEERDFICVWGEREETHCHTHTHTCSKVCRLQVASFSVPHV